MFRSTTAATTDLISPPGSSCIRTVENIDIIQEHQCLTINICTFVFRLEVYRRPLVWSQKCTCKVVHHKFYTKLEQAHDWLTGRWQISCPQHIARANPPWSRYPPLSQRLTWIGSSTFRFQFSVTYWTQSASSLVYYRPEPRQTNSIGHPATTSIRAQYHYNTKLAIANRIPKPRHWTRLLPSRKKGHPGPLLSITRFHAWITQTRGQEPFRRSDWKGEKIQRAVQTVSEGRDVDMPTQSTSLTARAALHVNTLGCRKPASFPKPSSQPWYITHRLAPDQSPMISRKQAKRDHGPWTPRAIEISKPAAESWLAAREKYETEEVHRSACGSADAVMREECNYTETADEGGMYIGRGLHSTTAFSRLLYSTLLPPSPPYSLDSI